MKKASLILFLLLLFDFAINSSIAQPGGPANERAHV